MARRKPPQITANAPIWGICRKSLEDKNKQIESISDQKALASQYYEERFPPEIRKTHPLRFVVTEQSGFLPGLPTVAEVCTAAQQGQVYGVIAVRVNRIGRNHDDLGKFTQDLADGFIPFLETTDGKRYRGEDAATIIMLCLEGAMGWHESAEKSKVVFDRMRLKAQNGKHMGRKMFGVRPHHVVLDNGEVLRHTEVDHERLPHLLTIFRMAAAGATYPDIERAMKNVTQRNGKPLNKTTIAGLIKNPYFKGATKYDGVIYEHTHEPLIAPELWEAAQSSIAKRCTHSGRKKKQDVRTLFTFGDTVRCGECGGVMSPYKVVKKKAGQVYLYYECKNRRTQCRQLIKQQRRDKDDREDGLREQFDAVMDSISVDDEVLADVREKLLALHVEKSAARRAEVEGLQQQYNDIEANLAEQVKALPKAKALGVEDIAEAEIKKLADERQRIKSKLDAVHDEGTDWITKVIGNFKLLELAREAINHGSPVVRESVIKALCSNLAVQDKKLVPELRSPFKETLNRAGDEEWWSIPDSNR